jgi:hypothetical protein
VAGGGVRRSRRAHASVAPALNLVDELHAIAAAFVGAGIRYAICGGLAVTMHGAPRMTKDIDILVDPEDLPRAVETVRPLGYMFAALPMVFDEGSVRERHVQRISKIVGGDHLVLDLLLAKASLARFLDGRVEVVLPEGVLAVVSREALLAMKRLAGRRQDQADIEKLETQEDA